MGIFMFMVGTISGIYIAQNYNVPNVKKLADTVLIFTQAYRKPEKKDSDKNRD